MVLWDEIGLCRKTIFQAPKIVFFSHAWAASNPRKIDMWIDLGTWNIAFPNCLKETEALRKNTFSSPDFFCTCLDCFQCGVIVKRQTTGKQENDILTDPVRCPKSPPPEFEAPTFKAEIQNANHYATGALPARNFAFWLSPFALASKGWAGEKQFRALKNRLFHTALMKLKEAALEKNNFSGSVFFHTALMKLREARLCKKNNFSGSKKMYFAY